jgi:hypothetical protein
MEAEMLMHEARPCLGICCKNFFLVGQKNIENCKQMAYGGEMELI